MGTTFDVVAAYHDALMARQFDNARRLLKDDLRFDGPFDRFSRADDYWAAIMGLWNIVDRIEIRHRSSSGSETVVLYDMVTKTSAGTQLVCEWLGVEGDQIGWIRTIFDSAPFTFLREKR